MGFLPLPEYSQIFYKVITLFLRIFQWIQLLSYIILMRSALYLKAYKYIPYLWV
ncbi:MAG: hypothetical protein BAJALOKI1v1_590007 [Promethearchaeota archaeon]|nr:MAG: hypothetical protein BAJALOKI1v1_590007 [Candidatus Lokiarchaeota archaeon]